MEWEGNVYIRCLLYTTVVTVSCLNLNSTYYVHNYTLSPSSTTIYYYRLISRKVETLIFNWVKLHGEKWSLFEYEMQLTSKVSRSNGKKVLFPNFLQFGISGQSS